MQAERHTLLDRSSPQRCAECGGVAIHRDGCSQICPLTKPEMADATDRNAAVHVLLEKASRARDGATLAREAMNTDAAQELNAKARALLQDAQAVDPTHEAPAWACFHEFLGEMEKT
jgi:hypothetical protein